MLFKAAFSFPKVTKLFHILKQKRRGNLKQRDRLFFISFLFSCSIKRYKIQLFSVLSGNDVIFLQQCRRVIRLLGLAQSFVAHVLLAVYVAKSGIFLHHCLDI